MNLSTTGLRLAADSAVDLHLHTTYSDGRWTPDELLDHLLGEQFALAAIADHDRADTVATVQQLAMEKGVPVLVAVEMSTIWKNELTDLALDAFHHQRENSREVFESLQRQGYALPPPALVLACPCCRAGGPKRFCPARGRSERPSGDSRPVRAAKCRRAGPIVGNLPQPRRSPTRALPPRATSHPVSHPDRGVSG